MRAGRASSTRWSGLGRLSGRHRPIRQVYTTRFVNKGIGLELKKKLVPGMMRPPLPAVAVTGRRGRRWSRCAASTRCSPTARWRWPTSISTIGRREFVSLLGPVGLRQEHGAAADRRARRGQLAARSSGRSGAGAGDIGFVFQEPTLMPWATVSDNVWLPLRLQGRARRRRRAEVDGGAGDGRPRAASPTPTRASSRAA